MAIDASFAGSLRVTTMSATRPATERSAAKPCDQPRKSGFASTDSEGIIASEKLGCGKTDAERDHPPRKCSQRLLERAKQGCLVELQRRTVVQRHRAGHRSAATAQEPSRGAEAPLSQRKRKCACGSSHHSDRDAAGLGEIGSEHGERTP